MLPRVGQKLGPYLLEAVLGRGGMGQVYAARDTLLERDVALKVLWQGDSGSLLDEGRALASIDHRSVVRVHGIDVTGPRPFVIMERIRGESLADLLERTSRIDRARALAILRGVAIGLDAIHAGGRIHGDVKPENVLLERDTGRVVLTDFGLSQAVAGVNAQCAGTPAYMAPEKARGDASRAELRPREDIYSLAVMAFELLTGRLPFDAPDMHEVLRQQAVDEPPRPRSLVRRLPWRVDGAILTSLAKRPESRHSTATAFVDALDRALSVRGAPLLLVADDDVDLARLLSLRLARRIPGAIVRTVGCGRAALEQIARELPDAVITDVEMPGMNGLELLAALRNDPRTATLPKIVLSGRARPSDFALLRRVGAVLCFEKPVNAEVLARCVREVLHLEPPAVRESGVLCRVNATAPTLAEPPTGEQEPG